MVWPQALGIILRTPGEEPLGDAEPGLLKRRHLPVFATFEPPLQQPLRVLARFKRLHHNDPYRQQNAKTHEGVSQS